MKPELRIFPDLEALSRAAAEAFAGAAARASEARGRFLVAISGGGTPLRTYALLASRTYRNRLDWARTYVFWADERCVPPDQAESNYGEAFRSFLGRVPIPTENLLRMRGEMQPESGVADYAQTLKRFAATGKDWPRFDLVLLGLGADGHTASLFPGSPTRVRAPVLAVSAEYQGRPARRMTLTPPVFNDARQVLFLVSGSGKARALASVLEESHQPERFPAQRIQPQAGKVVFMVDHTAAGGLRQEMR